MTTKDKMFFIYEYMKNNQSRATGARFTKFINRIYNIIIKYEAKKGNS